MSLVASDRWCPSLLAPVPQRVPSEPRGALAAVADGDEEVAGRDLEMLAASSRPAPLERTTPAQLMEQPRARSTSYWSGVLSPLWERVTDITNADISYRSRARLRGGGIDADRAAQAAELPRGPAAAADARAPRHRSARGAGVRFVPSVFAGPAWSPSRTRRRRW